MAVEAFLDTNVLIYAAAGGDDESRRRAAFACIAAANFGTSGQVLAEFYTNVTRKPAVPLTADEALAWIERLSEFPVVPVTHDLVRTAVGLSIRHKVSSWDAAVIGAAEEIGAKTLFTEDLNDGQTYGSVRVVNPFKIH
ncbi:PIN domain-containing protein [Prosthecomicrobium pneumaticum]|uniref:Putative nucleic acid-binding protein n=1 Tax=Prosthecomicrobium pneumaticum TaxID=81895 RepID=A0A7W9FN26_9HYPH|nr:PIN domain-containing protein [Prosthecomicrobium pneumaticum]MBB5753611.1 putative nucleic acid-binding protein [Prosthecomicrobium pneumaticum]